MEKANAEAISGSVIDDALLEEIKNAYWGIHTIEYDLEDGTAAGTSVTGTFDEKEGQEAMKARSQKREQYRRIYSYVRMIMGNYEAIHTINEEILCSRYGKKTLFFSKIAAGVTFGAGSSVILCSLAILSTLCVYGAEGFGVAVQVYMPICSRNLTMGQAVLLMSAVYIAAGIFCSIVVMFLSEAMKNSVAVMGLMTGGMIITMLGDIPYRFRVISQMYGLLPTVLLRGWQLWDDRLVSVFGFRFTNFQIAPVIYMAIGAALIFRGKRIYENYQVSGR